MKTLLVPSVLLLLTASLSAAPAPVNVALDAPAYANGPLYGADTPARLTDGLRNRQIHADVAPPAGFAYWIDLGSPRTLSSVRIWPRQDGCCPERFSRVRVSVHDDDGLDNIGAEVWGADLFTDGSNPGSMAGAVVNVSASMGAGTFAGRWVKLAVLGDTPPNYTLQVNELEVFAEGPENIALGSFATSSAPLYAGRSPAALVNGDRGSTGNEILHGDVFIDPGFHYDLNFGVEATISLIKIIARQDACCPERLSNYRVAIHQDNAGTIGDEVWVVNMRTDLSNPGSGPGAKDILTSDLDPVGEFRGQWLRVTSLDNPVPSYALQMSEIEVYGTLAGGTLLRPVSQPKRAVGNLSRTVGFTFNVVVIAGDPALLTYQWQKNGVAIPGATAATYTTPPLVSADGTNQFRCLASYPGEPTLTSDSVGVDLNFALGASAFANAPLWGPGGWNISLIVDGNHDADGIFRGVHADASPPSGLAYWFNMNTKVSISNIVVWARQDNCCAGRLTNYRLSVHDNEAGGLGAEVWGANLHTDGSNAGSGLGAHDTITADLAPAGVFEGQWIRIQSLEEPVPSYALQLTEIEVFGSVPPEPAYLISQQPANVTNSPFRSATFRIVATVINGVPGGLRYQWQRDGRDIAGATSATYVTPALCADEAGIRYRCVLSYPGLPDLPSEPALLSMDNNYARGSRAFANQPLWLPAAWSIALLVDGDRGGVFHGHENLQPGFAYTVNLGFPVQMDRIDLYPRQDNCCPDRFTNLRVSVHEDALGSLGPEVWAVSLFTDGTNPGSSVVSLAAAQDPAGQFIGQWVKIESLQNPVPDYALQMTELEVFGQARAICSKRATDGSLILNWDIGVLESAPNLSGPWNTVPGAVSPLTVSFTAPGQFYRLRL